MTKTKFGFARQNGALYGIQADSETEDVVDSLFICELSPENVDELIRTLQEVKSTFVETVKPVGVVLH